MSPLPSEQPVVVITGSSGLIGRALADRLAAAYTVVGADVAEPETPFPGRFHHVDVTSDASVARALATIRREQGSALAAVVHLADHHDFTGEPSPLYHDVGFEGTRRLLDGLGAFAVGELVFASTMLVHAPVGPDERIDETSPIDADSPYASAKLRTERLIRARRDAFPTLILRLAAAYTALGQQPTLVRQILRIRQRDLAGLLVPSDQRAGQALVHRDDVVSAIEAGIGLRGRLPGELTLLVGEEEPLTHAALQDRIGTLLWDREWPALRAEAPADGRAGWDQARPAGADPFTAPIAPDLGDHGYALDLARARRFLEWEPRHGLASDLPVLLERLQQDPGPWHRANGLPTPRPVVPESRR